MWDLMLFSGTGIDGAVDEQKRRFATAGSYGSRELGLGFGDEARWVDEGSTTTCALAVRDANLLVTVKLSVQRHPGPSCRQDARNLARTALAATRR
ncbi:hypothetical protein [Streptomyces sp. NBC_01443]|uniref:hypothetical protein n=1 Tax=Streptomyces sp. NBC_01443 TaxID=2903868 RepID=UPI0022572208|nr:hypothetical protein [Streptomyces sp. NBC_01443]MCX4630116.1 hypothetical protein [Streptomyces sp. NBC_01443]